MPLAAVGQIRSTASMRDNLAQCQKLVRKASAAGAKALFLPEASDYIGSSDLCRSAESSEFVLGLRAAAEKYALPISVGIHEPAVAPQVKNTLIWINEQGHITQRYQKVHLFDVNIKDGPHLQESDSVEPGKQLPVPFETPVGRVGPLICFDLRFPEPAIALRARGAHILTYPSAFTTPTGQAGHWEILLRARAIETQSYIIAAAQVGSHDDEGKRRSYGHSMIVDPWGKLVASLGGDGGTHGGWTDECEIAVADIDSSYVERIRQEMRLVRPPTVYSHIN